MTRPGPARLRVIGLPADGHAYQDCFYAALRERGVEVVSGCFAGRWLRDNVGRGDIVHLHWPSFFYAEPTAARTAAKLAKYVGFLAMLRLRGARLVWTAHNLYPHQPSPLRGADRIARRVTTRLAERIYAHGAHAADAVADEFGVAHGKIVPIPHGHWIGHFGGTLERAEARRRLGIDPQARMLLLFGGLEPYKNVPLLLRAYERVRRPGDTLWIVGRCKHEAVRRQMREAAERLDDVRVVERYVADAEIPVYMHAADAVVLPYRDGLTSGAAMLALSHGVPVIAPRVGCFATVVDAHSGLLYDAGAADAAEALAGALHAARERRFDPAAIRARADGFRWPDAADAFVRSMR